MKHAVKLVKEAADSYVVGGYGVIFGGKDLRGEWFTPSTDLWLDRITSTPPVLYDHGFNVGTGKAVLGQVIAHKIDDLGLWIEAEISAASQYAEAVRELIRKGVLGWSSGAVQHLCEIDRSGEIKAWPIAEFSLTATPCEPRTVGVSELEALDHPAVKSLVDQIKALPAGPTPMDGDGWCAPVGTDEHKREALERLARGVLTADPYCCGWAWVVQTYPDYCIVCVEDGGSHHYYRIAYAMGDDGLPVLGEVEEVQRAYIPIESPPAEMAATATLSAYTVRSATALAARVRVLHEGRVREGRTLSPANRERVKANREALAGLLSDYDALLTETEPKRAAEVGATDAAVEVQAAYARILALASGVEVTP